MRKTLFLFFLIISLTFTGCTVPGDDLTSINNQLSSINQKVAQLEAENEKLKAELQQINSESGQSVKISDEPTQTLTPAIDSTITSSPTPTPAPTSTPTLTPSPTPKIKVQSTENNEITVYVTKTGSKYHSSGCRYLSKSKISISLKSAKQNYTPCSVCSPPR